MPRGLPQAKSSTYWEADELPVQGSPYNPLYGRGPALRDPSPRLRFSPVEVIHLSLAVLILTAAFSVALPGLLEGGSFDPRDIRFDPGITIAAFAAVASGFIFHELAHKVVAQRYGHWAEFRAQFVGLGFSLLLAIGTGILFAAPGAVMIYGRVTPRENAAISIVGPGTNAVIALIAYPFTFQTNTDSLGYKVAFTVAAVNALLAVFNMLPFGPLDGRKVLYWNKPLYFGSLLLFVALFVLVLWGPLGT